jgi:hypothetical protein
MSAARSAASDGRRPFDSNFARMKESTGVRIQLLSLTDGIEGRASGRNDHQFSGRSCARKGHARINVQLSKTADLAAMFSEQLISHPIAGFASLQDADHFMSSPWHRQIERGENQQVDHVLALRSPSAERNMPKPCRNCRRAECADRSGAFGSP